MSIALKKKIYFYYFINREMKVTDLDVTDLGQILSGPVGHRGQGQQA